VKALGKPSEILTKLNEMAGFSPSEEIELYEVIHNSVFISIDYTNIQICSLHVLPCAPCAHTVLFKSLILQVYLAQ
jgi:hypothetical protein